MRETGNEILRCAQNDNGGESHHRLRAVPLPLTREAKDEGRGTGVAEPRPYGAI